jgi:hypothetical protein|tara:strand:+ start:462 stop:773 length:312 start_codon:yes stop_codon:yes gene_type:complete
MKMSQYDNNNRGAIWANVKTKESQPDFTGSILVDGKDYFLSGWKRKADANPKGPALSLAVTVKDNQPHTQAPQQSTQMAEAKAAMTEWDKGPSDGFGDDDIPF